MWLCRKPKWKSCAGLPRSEHCTTLRWHWHLKGHFGITGITGSCFTSGTPDPASSSIMKSKKPDWRKGRAQQAVTRSRERQADLMVLLAGSLWNKRTGFKGLGWICLQSTLWSVWMQATLLNCFWFTAQGSKGHVSEVKAKRVKHLGVKV